MTLMVQFHLFMGGVGGSCNLVLLPEHALSLASFYIKVPISWVAVGTQGR
jgi:hypothetical protein